MIPRLADPVRHLQLALEEVLERMFYLSPDGEAALPAALPEPWLAAQLHFTGPVTGHLGIAVRPATAVLLVNNFLGQDFSERPATQLADLLGELVNMVAGTLLGRVTRRHAFDLSPPQSVPLASSLSGSLSGSSADSRPCSPPNPPSILQTVPQSLRQTGPQSCSPACPMSCLSWPEIRLSHEIVRAYAFEGQLFLAWLHCDPDSCEPDESSTGAVSNPAHNPPGFP